VWTVKIQGTPVPSPEQLPRQSAAFHTPAASAAKVPAGAADHSSLSRIFAPLGLPADSLSAALVSFARFFSLPLSLLSTVRREVLPPPSGAGSPPEAADAGSGPVSPEAGGRSPEALSLAALAAADKGLELSRAELERYAAAIDPQNPPDNPAPGNQNQGNRDRPKDRSGSGEDQPEGAAALAGDPARLKAALCAAGEADPLLDVLNRLPGGNGQRWIVLPFCFVEQGEEWRVSLRVLLNQEGPETGRAEHLALEILRGSGGAARRSLFVMDHLPGTGPRLRICVSEGHSPPVSLARELAAFMGLPPECVLIQKGDEYFPFTGDTLEMLLRSVNEAV
jgi:hypothetical protein